MRRPLGGGRGGGGRITLRLGNDLDFAVAAYRQFDVLMVNGIFDGMNLVAKEAHRPAGRRPPRGPHHGPRRRKARREMCADVVRENDVTKWFRRQLDDLEELRRDGP